MKGAKPVTMPHLMNCDHSEHGWCLGCVSKLYYEKEAALATPAPEPLYQHTAEELRYVADILDALNKQADGERSMIGCDGELELYWCDRVMGVIGLDDGDDLSSWVYYPSANDNYKAKQ